MRMDIERTMEFILQQQAANTADIAQLKESIIELRNSAEFLFNVQEHHERRIVDLHQSHSALVDAQVRSEERIQSLGRTMAELTAAQKKTDETFREFIRFSLERDRNRLQ
jgi:chromosome segregation ATPase